MLHNLYSTVVFVALMWSGEPKPVYPELRQSDLL